jgi:asparagine synthase (glutamine-hydrolysing)
MLGTGSDTSLECQDSQGARLIILGVCLLGPAELAAAFSAAVQAGRPERIAECPGAYTAIILRDGEITAYTDLAGQFPLYYSRCAGELLIGPDPAGIAAAHHRVADPLSAAAHITCPGILPLWWGRSAYADVRRLEGGMTLRAGPGGLEISAARLPLPVPGTSLSEGAARLRDALSASIRVRRARADEPVSADFSGGLDSSSVAFLAAGCGTAPVTSISYHHPLAPAADQDDAVRLAALSSAIDLTVVSGSAETLPFAGIAEALAGGISGAEPVPQLLAARRDAMRLAAASAAGTRLHLTGEGGDAILMGAPSYLADLARRRALGTLWRHCGDYGRLRHVAPAALAARAIRLAGTSAGSALRAAAGDLARPVAGSANWGDLVAWWPRPEMTAWLTAGTRRQLAELAGDPETARTVPAGVGPADLASLVDLRRSGAASQHLRTLGRRHGLAVQAPFLDSAVVRAALSTAAATRAGPMSYKPMLGAALAGLVPAQVLARRTKGDYSAEYYLGARRVAAELRTLLSDSHLADLGVIEPGSVLPVLDRMLAGIAVPLGPLTTLVATEVWLRAQACSGTGKESPC